MKVIGRMGTHAQLANVEDAKNAISPNMQALAAMIGNPEAIGRPFYAPPEVPRERVQILREAFRKALHDPEALAESAKARRDVQWMSGEDVEKLNHEILATPDAVVAQFLAMQ